MSLYLSLLPLVFYLIVEPLHPLSESLTFLALLGLVLQASGFLRRLNSDTTSDLTSPSMDVPQLDPVFSHSDQRLFSALIVPAVFQCNLSLGLDPLFWVPTSLNEIRQRALFSVHNAICDWVWLSSFTSLGNQIRSDLISAWDIRGLIFPLYLLEPTLFFFLYAIFIHSHFSYFSSLAHGVPSVFFPNLSWFRTFPLVGWGVLLLPDS